MIQKPLTDHGQQLPPPAGKVIGFFDDKAKFDSFAESVSAAGFPASAIQSLEGQDGIQLLERLKKENFFFGDSEDDAIKLSVQELEQGHLTAIVKVKDRDQAIQVAQLAQLRDGRGLRHFETWTTEQLPT
jgi:hypothetical protein